MRHWLVAPALVALLVGCATQVDETRQSPQPTPTTTGFIPPGVPTEGNRPPADGLPPPAEPQQAPQQTAPIPGRIVPVGAAPEGVVVDAATRTVAVAKRDPNEFVLINADTGQIERRVPLPGFVRHLQLADPGGPILVPVESANALVRVELPSGRALSQILTGTVPHDASQAENATVFVANEHGGTVTVLRGIGDREGLHRQRSARRTGAGRSRHGPHRRPQERPDDLRRADPVASSGRYRRVTGPPTWWPTGMAA